MKEKVEDPDIPNVFVEITDDGGPGWPPEKFLLPFALAVGTCLLIMLVLHDFNSSYMCPNT